MSKLREAEEPTEKDNSWFEGPPLKIGGEEEFLGDRAGESRTEPTLSDSATSRRGESFEPEPFADFDRTFEREEARVSRGGVSELDAAIENAAAAEALNPEDARREPSIAGGSFSATRTPPPAAEPSFGSVSPASERLVADHRPAAPAAEARPAKERAARTRAPAFGAGLASLGDTLFLIIGAPTAILAVTLASVYLFPGEPSGLLPSAPDILDQPSGLASPSGQAAMFERRTEPDETVTPPELAEGAPAQAVARASDGLIPAAGPSPNFESALKRNATPPFSALVIETEEGDLAPPPAFSAISAPAPHAGGMVFPGVFDTLPGRDPDASPGFPTVRAAPTKPLTPLDADEQPEAGAPDEGEQVANATSDGAPIVHVAASLVNRVSDASPSAPEIFASPARPEGPNAQESVDPLRSRAPFLPLDTDPGALFKISFSAPRPFTAVDAAKPTTLAADPAPTSDLDLERAPDAAPSKPSFSDPRRLVIATMGDIDSLSGIDRSSDPEPYAPESAQEASDEAATDQAAALETASVEAADIAQETAETPAPDAAEPAEAEASGAATAAEEMMVAESPETGAAEQDGVEDQAQAASGELIQAALQQDAAGEETALEQQAVEEETALVEDPTDIAPELSFRPPRRAERPAAATQVSARAGEAAPNEAPRPTPRW